MQISEEVLEAHPRSATKLIDVLPGAIITAAITLLFFSLYWNRFAGLRSGNGSFQGGMALLRGILPYRDYFTAGPPLDQVISAALLGVFGHKLIVIRAWGVFEHVALATLLYFWLLRLFEAKYAALASIVAIIASAGDPSNAIASYGFEAISFFVLSGWSVTLAGRRGRSQSNLIVWAAASGLFAALSFGAKQTLGLGATAGIPLLAFLYVSRMGGWRRAAIFLAGFAAGWALGAGAILLWLADVGVVNEFLQDAFKKGPSAKASHPSDFVIRAAHAACALKWGFAAACAGLAVSWPALRRAGRSTPSADRSPSAVWIAVVGALAIALGAVVSYVGKWSLHGFASFSIYVSFLGSALLLAYYAMRFLRGELSERESQIALLAGISFGITLMVGLSWPALYDMVFPGLALILAASLQGSTRVLRNGIYVVCALIIFALTCERLNLPQGFHEWVDQPVRLANMRSSLPELEGMRLPAATVRFLDETVHTVQQQSTTSDTIFVYPEFGILYTLAQRRYPTATDSHNIDVVNDEFARSEAQRLLTARPAVVVYYPVPSWSLRADERLWRNGKESGQRDLIAAVEQLTKEYRVAATYKLPPNESPVTVYVRR